MIKLGVLVFIAIFAAASVAPVLAELMERRPMPGRGWNSGKPAVGTPGPVAGAGVGILAAGGLYLAHRSRKQKKDGRSDKA